MISLRRLCFALLRWSISRDTTTPPDQLYDALGHQIASLRAAVAVRDFEYHQQERHRDADAE